VFRCDALRMDLLLCLPVSPGGKVLAAHMWNAMIARGFIEREQQLDGNFQWLPPDKTNSIADTFCPPNEAADTLPMTDATTQVAATRQAALRTTALLEFLSGDPHSVCLVGPDGNMKYLAGTFTALPNIRFNSQPIYRHSSGDVDLFHLRNTWSIGLMESSERSATVFAYAAMPANCHSVLMSGNRWNYASREGFLEAPSWRIEEKAITPSFRGDEADDIPRSPSDMGTFDKSSGRGSRKSVPTKRKRSTSLGKLQLSRICGIFGHGKEKWVYQCHRSV